jgi:hypothetical protein
MVLDAVEFEIHRSIQGQRGVTTGVLMLVALLGSDWGLGGGSLEVLASARSALDARGGGRRALLAGDAELLLG